MPTYSLAQLRTEVGYTADVTIQVSGRYPVAMVNGWINTALANYAIERAEYVGADEARTTITGSTSTALTQGFPQNQILALPSNFLKLKAAWITTPNGRRQLDYLAESDRWDWDLQLTGEPQGCRVTSLADGTAALRVWPAMSAAYTFEVIYTPGAPTLVADGDLWTYEAGCEDLVICEVAQKILDRDNIPEPDQYRALTQRRANAAEQMRRVLASQDSGVKTVRDTRGQRIASMRRDWLR